MNFWIYSRGNTPPDGPYHSRTAAQKAIDALKPEDRVGLHISEEPPTTNPDLK